MAISDTQKVDYLYKKLGYGVAKTDTSSVKSPSNEANASPLLIRGDTLWVSSGNVPASAPSSNSSVVAVYTGTAAVKTVNDGTSSTNRTWLTNLSDWIGSEFGATYQPRVWAAPSATANAAATGTRLFPDGSGNNDSWFFDPQAGILNFADTNVPTAVTGNVVFIEGYRYIGPKGVANATGNIIFSNVTITNNFANANIYLTPTGTGQVVATSSLTANAGIQNTVIGNTGAAAGYFTTINSTGAASLNSLTANANSTFNSNLTVLGNLIVQGNTITTGSNNVSFTDSIIELHTLPNLGNLTFNDGRDIGIRFHYYFTQNQDAALVLANDTGFLEWYGAFAAETANLNIGANATYGTFKSGEILLANSTISTSSSTGALRVSGGAGITGNLFVGNILTANGGLQNTPIGNVTPSTALFTTVSTSGNTTVSALTVNNSATVNGTLGIVGTLTGTTINASTLGNSGAVFTGATYTATNSFNGPLNGTLGSAGGNTAIVSTLSATSNATVSALTVNGSAVVGTSLQVQGGLQATPIGNVTPSTALFTSIGSSGNVTASSLTVNNSATIGSTLGVVGTLSGATITATGNVTAAGLASNASITAGTTISAPAGLQATPIGNVTPSTATFTSAIVSGALSVGGNATVNALATNGSAVINTTLQAIAGIQNTPIGNVTPSTGNFTTLNASSGLTGSSLTVNSIATIGTTLTVGGTATVNSLISNGAVSGTTAQFTTINGSGNATVSGLNVNNSATIGTTLSANAGIQNTAIGNVTPSTGNFTTLGTTGNLTVSQLTVNTTATVGTSLGVGSNVTVGTGTGGNITGANIISANSFTAAVSFNGPVNGTLGSAGGNTAIVTTLSATGNVTAAAVTSNGSITASTTISATAGIQNTAIGNATASTGNFTTLSASSLSISGNAIVGNLDVLGNVTYINSTVTTIVDPIIELNTGANGAPLSGSAPYDSGIKTHYWDGSADRQSFFGRANDSGFLEYYSNVISESGNIITGTYGTVKTGNLLLTGNATIASTLTVQANTTVNALTVNNSGTFNTTLSALGGLQATPIGNVAPSTALFTSVGSSGNVTASALTVNNSATIGSTLGVVGTLTGTTINAATFGNTGAVFTGATYTATNSFNGPLNGTLGSAGGNTAIVSTLTATGNATVNALTVNSSTVVGTTLQALGGIQATPIGNVTASSGQFTTVSATGNITGAAVTSNGSITAVTTLSALGGIQATPIGNVAPSTAIFTTQSVSGNSTVNALTVNASAVMGTTLQALGGIQATPIGNVVPSTATFTSQSTSGNATVNGLTVNGSATVGTTISAPAGLQATPIGNVTPSTALFTTIGSSGNITASALTVNNSVTVGTTLGVTGNATVGNILANAFYFANGAPFTSVGGTTGQIQYNNAGNPAGATYLTYISGNGQIVANAGISSTNTLTGTMVVTGGVGVSGNINTDGLAVSNSTTIGSTLSVTGNVTLSANITSPTNTNVTLAPAGTGVVSIKSGVGGATGIAMGTPTQGNLTSNAVTLTVDSSITNSIAQLNVVLGKLVPTAPNNFPSTYTLTVTTATVGPYRMANTSQTDNTNSGGKTVAAGTSLSVIRGSSYTTSTIANVGPGDSGVLTGYRNGVAVGNVALTGSSNGTYSNLVVLNNQDYHNVVSSVSAGFWYSFSTYMSGVVQPGWNEVNIKHSTTANSAVPYWYYDSTSPGTPTWSNVNIALASNSSTYSSTIPHLNTSSIFTLTANVARLSGDTFPSSNTFVTGTAGGAIAAPSSVTYAQAVGITYPLAQNLYVSSGSAYLSTNAAVASGFGSSSTGPSLTADNSYSTAAQSFTTALGKTVLYKTGTASSMEETSITFGSTVGVGSGLAFRIINPGSADTPTYTGTEAAFDSQTSTLQTYDATIVAAVLKNDTTNYSTGYLPVGPNLSGQGASQYFTFKFIRTSVSKFDIRWTGTIAGLWVALPGSTIDSASTLNGWIDLSVAYGGSGIPGANTGAGGNGSNGGSLGGTAPLNSAQTNKSITATFGTVSSSSTATNEIYVRIKLTTGQTVTALSLQTASN